MTDPLRPFRVLRPGWHMLDFVWFWSPWLSAALWWWRQAGRYPKRAGGVPPCAYHQCRTGANRQPLASTLLPLYRPAGPSALYPACWNPLPPALRMLPVQGNPEGTSSERSVERSRATARAKRGGSGFA